MVIFGKERLYMLGKEDIRWQQRLENYHRALKSIKQGRQTK